MTCFYHIEGQFKAVYVLMQNSFTCTMIGRYGYAIPKTPYFAIAELLTTCRHSSF